MAKYRGIMAEVFGVPWAIQEAKLGQIVAFMAMKADGIDPPKVKAAAQRSPQIVAGSIAVIPIQGVIGKKMNMIMDFSGGTSTDMLTALFRQAMADPDVKGIVFDVDSPGGTVPGVPELWQEIYSARGQGKPIWCAINPSAGSAGYWLASATEKSWVTMSGQAGSIGVFAAHECCADADKMMGIQTTLVQATDSPYKTEMSPFSPLSEEAKAEILRGCDATCAMFIGNVAKGRGVPPSTVKRDFGGGRMKMAQEAIDSGMADSMGTLEDCIRRMLGRGGAAKMAARAELTSVKYKARKLAPELVAGADVDDIGDDVEEAIVAGLTEPGADLVAEREKEAPGDEMPAVAFDYQAHRARMRRLTVS